MTRRKKSLCLSKATEQIDRAMSSRKKKELRGTEDRRSSREIKDGEPSVGPEFSLKKS
jgi:hypothetical protein